MQKSFAGYGFVKNTEETLMMPQLKTCLECGCKYQPARAFQKYCPDCRQSVEKAHQALWGEQHKKGWTPRVCQYCGKQYVPVGPTQRYCKDCAPGMHEIYRRAHLKEYAFYSRDYQKKHPEEITERGRVYYMKHRKGQIEKQHVYYRKNSERVKAANNRWSAEHPTERDVINKRHKAKRRSLGYVYLNAPFAGCEGHHVDNEQVIHMPKPLHRSVYHRQRDSRGMAQINAIAYNFLFKQEVEAAMAKVSK